MPDEEEKPKAETKAKGISKKGWNTAALVKHKDMPKRAEIEVEGDSVPHFVRNGVVYRQGVIVKLQGKFKITAED